MHTAHSLLDRIMQDGRWDIDWAAEYVEPGHTAGSHGILFADWNNEQRRATDAERADGQYWIDVSDFRSRFARILERAGYACEWSDEWTICACGKAVRMTADSWDWRPSFVANDGDFACRECWRDCLSVADRMEYCRDMGVSPFAARRDTLPERNVRA